MCCCVGSTIGEGEPEGLAREGAIYIDEEAPALYYFDGTEWVVLPGGDSAITEWTTAGRPDPATVGQHGHNTDLNVFEEWNGTSWEVLNNYTNPQYKELSVSSVTGSDVLTDYEYLFNGGVFKTLDAALQFVGRSTSQAFYVTVYKDSIINNPIQIYNKTITIEFDTTSLALDASISFINCSVTIVGLTTMARSNIYIKDTSLTINGGTLQGLDVTPLIVFGGVSHLNIGRSGLAIDTVEDGVIFDADTNTGETNINISPGSLLAIANGASGPNVSLYSTYANTIVNTIRVPNDSVALSVVNINQDYNAIIIYNDYLQFNDNADAISLGYPLGSVYKTPDGVLHQVMASVPARLRTVIFEIDISDFNNISSPDPVPYTILLSDYEGILGTDIFKSSDQTFGFDTVCILVSPEILNFNIIMPTRIDNLKYTGYLHSENSLKIQGFETTNSLARLTSIDSAMGSIRATIQFLA